MTTQTIPDSHYWAPSVLGTIEPQGNRLRSRRRMDSWPRYPIVESPYIDAIALPKVGIHATGHEVVLFIEDGKETVERAKSWLDPTVESLVAILFLKEEWNSYGAKQIQPIAVERMLELLLSVLEPDVAPPSVVPTAQGGVQVEWHRRGIDFELEASRDGELQYFFSGAQEESEGPVPFEREYSVLKPFIKYLKAT